MVRPAPHGQVSSAPKGHRWMKLPRRNPRTPLPITVKWRGGPEGWVEVHARGDVGRFPGDTPIATIVLLVNGGPRT